MLNDMTTRLDSNKYSFLFLIHKHIFISTSQRHKVSIYAFEIIKPVYNFLNSLSLPYRFLVSYE